MSKMFTFHKTYFCLTLLLFATEVLIALYAHDDFIRPYFGDFLVVMLIYCFSKSFLNTRPVITAIAVLLFSYFIELTQYFNLVHHLGLDSSKIANVVMGNYFAWVDILAYTLGVAVVIVSENLFQKQRQKQKLDPKEHSQHFI